jgi:hypothetical protein
MLDAIRAARLVYAIKRLHTHFQADSISGVPCGRNGQRPDVGDTERRCRPTEYFSSIRWF